MILVDFLIVFVLFIFGLLIGSFINAAEFRLAKGWRLTVSEDGQPERSVCPECGEQIWLRDLVPVLSYAALQGSCRFCHQRISPQYPVIELATALVFAVIAYRFGWSIETLLYAVISAFLVFIFLYDLKHELILDAVSIPAIVFAFFASFFLDLTLLDVLLGAAIGGGFFAIQFLASQGKWVGGGDIRLGILMGIVLGWGKVLLALLLAYVAGALIALVLLALKKMDRKSHIPFGTFLSGATLVAILYGNEIIDWYFGLLL